MQTHRIQKKAQWVHLDTHISVIRRTANKPVSMHLHDYFELEIVISGNGEHILNGTVYPVGPGTAYLITPIDFHSLTPDGEITLLNVSFDESVLTTALQMRFLNRRENLIFSDADGVHQMELLAAQLATECRSRDSYSSQARVNLLELLLFAVVRNVDKQSNADTPLTSVNVEKSLQFLFQHFREDISLETVAAQSGYTPNYFSHLFHRISGQKYVDFLTQLRLNYAKTKLLSSTAPASEIAISSGFSSQSNFFRAFRKETGISPLEYRKQKTEAK